MLESFYSEVFKVGRYSFNFRPNSDEDREFIEDQSPSRIGRGRTINIVRIGESGASYEQITSKGFFEVTHEHILEDIQKRLSRKRIWPIILISLFAIIFLIYKLAEMTGKMEEDFLYKIIAFAIVGLLGGWPFLYFIQKRRKTAYLVNEYKRSFCKGRT